MASYYFRNTGNTNWGVATNWSTTDGGIGDGAVPTSTDDAWFSNNSGNCVVDTTPRNCRELNFTKGTGFTGSFTMTQTLTINNSGNVTFSSGMSVPSAAGILQITTTSTINTNGISLGCSLTLSGTVTITLASNITHTGTALNLSLAGTTTLTGSFTIFSTCTAYSTAGVLTSASTKVELQGAVTITNAGRIAVLEFILNTGTNTFNILGAFSIGDSTNASKLTYTSGRPNIGPASILSLGGNVTLDTFPLQWNQIDCTLLDSAFVAGKTFTLNSTLDCTGMIKLGGNGTNINSHGITFSGTSGFTCGSLVINVVNSGRPIVLGANINYYIQNIFISSGLIGTPNMILKSSSAGTRSKIICDKGCTTLLSGIDVTDVDNGSGFPIYLFPNGVTPSTQTTSGNFIVVPVNTKIPIITNINNGLNMGIVQGLY